MSQEPNGDVNLLKCHSYKWNLDVLSSFAPKLIKGKRVLLSFMLLSFSKLRQIIIKIYAINPLNFEIIIDTLKLWFLFYFIFI